MRADLSTCQQIQCGAITQDQAGADLLLACSEAGYVGARSCMDSLCAPYHAAMASNGECPDYGGMISMLSPPVYMPRPTTQTMPDIVSEARGPRQVFSPRTILNPMPTIVPPPTEEPMPQVCNTFTSWVATNPMMAALGLVGLYFLLRK